MFIGHFGVGLGAKSAAPAASLGSLFLAAQFTDLLWPTLLVLGVEQAEIEPGITEVTPIDFVSYPISHSLLLVAGWALIFGLGHFFLRRSVRTAVVLGLLVLSHWVLDLVVHRPDLPIYPGAGSPKVGLGLWHSLPATLVLEALIFAAGIIFYVRATDARDGVGRYGFWFLVAFLALIHFANTFGPPPPDITAVAWAGHLQWILVGAAFWIDAHRTSIAATMQA